jgi:hypothetical protein
MRYACSTNVQNTLFVFLTTENPSEQQKFKEILLSRWDPSRLPKPEHGNAENTRRWIRAVYVDKAFEYRAPPTNKQPSSGQQQRTSAPKPTVDDLLGNWDTPAQPDPTHITGQVAQIPAPAPVFDMFGPNQGQHHQHQLQQQQQYVAPQYQQAPINLGQGQGQGYAMGSPPQQDYFNPFAPQMLAAQQQPPIPAAPVAGGAPKQQPNPMQPYPGQPLIIQQPPYNHQQPSQPVYVNPFGGQPMMIPQGQQMLINPHHQQQPGQPVRPMMVTNLPNGQQVMVLQQHPPMGTMIAQPQQPNGMYNNPFGGVAFPPQHPQQMPPQTGPVANPGGFFAVPQVGFGGQQPPLQQPQNLHPIGGIRPRTDWNQRTSLRMPESILQPDSWFFYRCDQMQRLLSNLIISPMTLMTTIYWHSSSRKKRTVPPVASNREPLLRLRNPNSLNNTKHLLPTI